MPSKPAQNNSGAETDHNPLHLVAWLLMVIGVYVLSTGPVIKIARRANSTPFDNIVMAVYYPLASLSDRSSVAKNFFEWYVTGVWSTNP